MHLGYIFATLLPFVLTFVLTLGPHWRVIAVLSFVPHNSSVSVATIDPLRHISQLIPPWQYYLSLVLAISHLVEHSVLSAGDYDIDEYQRAHTARAICHPNYPVHLRTLPFAFLAASYCRSLP